ncbi:hypothetical protein [Actinomadura sp. WAC 06369]|nr:hypothetical protein [Actinomadura sp. WAC 06369]
MSEQAITASGGRAPGDIAEVVSFLASPAGHRVTGQVVRANGGAI